jgi:hypothetical protein|tara:strand:- start:1474 stop:1752 length:279 start_codon:yes stop_codon:yes gene_type:complete
MPRKQVLLDLDDLRILRLIILLDPPSYWNIHKKMDMAYKNLLPRYKMLNYFRFINIHTLRNENNRIIKVCSLTPNGKRILKIFNKKIKKFRK